MKKIKSNVIALATLLLFSGCNNQAKRDKRFVDGFAAYLINRANIEAMRELTPDERNGVLAWNDDANIIDACVNQGVGDSLLYLDALKRYADVGLNWKQGARTYDAVWDSVQKAPRYEYGKGSVINDQGQWEYGDHVVRGWAGPALRCRENYKAYKKTVKKLYILRQKQRRMK